MKCNNCNKDIEVGYCDECMQKAIDNLQNEKRTLMIENKRSSQKQDETISILTIALFISGAIAGIFSAFFENQFVYAWYWNVLSFILYAFGGAILLGGISSLLAVIIHFAINSIRKANK